MWHGIYKRWTPLTAWSSCRVEIEALHDDLEGFRFWLQNHDPRLGRVFVQFDSPLFYCASDESNRVSELKPEQADLQFPHVFWTVDDSELVRIFNRQSCNLHADFGIVHYCFLSCNQCIDVLSCKPPLFTGDTQE